MGRNLFFHMVAQQVAILFKVGVTWAVKEYVFRIQLECSFKLKRISNTQFCYGAIARSILACFKRTTIKL